MLEGETDPVCGMPVGQSPAATVQFAGRTFYFCSEFCKQQFERHPGAYGHAPSEALPPALSWAERRVAYFSMEIALANEIPTYAGGLGVLAGDSLLSAADLEIPVVAVTLVHRCGYFRQEVDQGRQKECDASWQPEQALRPVEAKTTLELEGRTVSVRGWRYDVVGSSGYRVPVILLDSDMPENRLEDRQLTSYLYGGDTRYRLMQEAILGIGGVRLLHALGCDQLTTFHLNEGHAALAPVEILRRTCGDQNWDFGAIRKKMVFTTHTPVAAGHDRFDWSLVRQVLAEVVPERVFTMLGGSEQLNMTQLALNSSHYVNGVALRHREVSSQLFPQYEIHQVTNGVHSRSWTSEPFRSLFDRYIPGWRHDPLMLRNGVALPPGEVWQAHEVAKDQLFELVARRTGRNLRRDVLTLGFARRATAYKRPQLIFSDLERLRCLARVCPLQIVFAGKAHPKDEAGKAGIQAVLAAASQLGEDLPVVYLVDYDLELAVRLVAGVDVWLNTPQRPQEASGTSGMKAAHNGVPSLSVLDGWWR
ncbi:MAG TPA: alpha-glucan family phosphorylase, partial [Polyangiaceae bacterium]|nr:alpha-glucan family phosphorylase [Polyangiaceae bacterium]